MAKGKPFAPGVSGNPAGRPRGRGLKAAIEAELAQERAGYLDRSELIARRIVDLAEAGDMRAIEFLGRRLWPEKVEIDQASLFTIDLIDLSGQRHLADESSAPAVASDCEPSFEIVKTSDEAPPAPTPPQVPAPAVLRAWRPAAPMKTQADVD